jgi:hypothetical protein
VGTVEGQLHNTDAQLALFGKAARAAAVGRLLTVA